MSAQENVSAHNSEKSMPCGGDMCKERAMGWLPDCDRQPSHTYAVALRLVLTSPPDEAEA